MGVDSFSLINHTLRLWYFPKKMKRKQKEKHSDTKKPYPDISSLDISPYDNSLCDISSQDISPRDISLQVKNTTFRPHMFVNLTLILEI